MNSVIIWYNYRYTFKHNSEFSLKQFYNFYPYNDATYLIFFLQKNCKASGQVEVGKDAQIIYVILQIKGAYNKFVIFENFARAKKLIDLNLSYTQVILMPTNIHLNW